MGTRTRWITRRALALAVAAVGVVAIAGTAVAGHQTSGVKSYTGCLVPNDGVIVKIKEGNAPKSACTGGQVEAHFSGGDITKISVGNGLTLPNGSDNGEVRIELAAGQTLPSGCAAGRVVEWSGSAWICGVDNDTTYTEGTGLDLTGTTFSIQPDYRVKNNPDCESGKFATGFDGSGTIQCTAPPASGVEVWQSIRPTDTVVGGVIVLPKDEGVDLIQIPLPAGTYLVTAVTTISDRNSDDEIGAKCRLRNGAFLPLAVHSSTVDIGKGSLEATGVVTVHGVVALASPDTVRFTCTAFGGDSEDDQADNATMTAIKVGTVHTS